MGSPFKVFRKHQKAMLALLGVLALRLGERERGVAALRRALAIAPDHAGASAALHDAGG